MAKSDKLSICITGPECTGKTSMSAMLAEYYQCHWLPEHARAYLNDLNRPYKIDDLELIAMNHQVEMFAYLDQSESPFIFDTDHLTTLIWAQDKFGSCPQSIENLYKASKMSLYLLCYPDLEWHDDPQRENPNDRMRIFDLYRERLNRDDKKYLIIKGFEGQRVQNAIDAIKEYLESIT